MRTAVIFGGPNLHSNTHAALTAWLEEEGIEVFDRYDLVAHRIEPCRGCLACRSTGTCVIRDHHPELVEQLLDYDRLVFASPVYFNSVTGQTKVFIDRLETLFHRKMHLGTLESRVQEVRAILTAGTRLNGGTKAGIYELFRLVGLCFGRPDTRVWLVENLDSCEEPTRIEITR